VAQLETGEAADPERAGAPCDNRRMPWSRVGCSLVAKISKVLVLLAVGAMFVGCSRGTPITVINQSDAGLEDVVLSGSGFTVNVGRVQPNAQARMLVRPQGESGLRMHFNARGKAFSFGPDGYFEGAGGYLVTVTVSSSLAVSVKSELAR
jgi:hypothetical protein